VNSKQECSKYSDIVLSHGAYGEEEFAIKEFLTEKDALAFTRSVERMIRTSEEYKRWLRFVHGALTTDFMCYKTGDEPDFCKIELHHHPITLYDYVQIALFNTNHYTTYAIAQEVMSWHFKNWVGFIPLSRTEHEKYHNGYFSIPIDLVEGNWMAFVERKTIPMDISDKVTAQKTVDLKDVESEWFVKEQRYYPTNAVVSTETDLNLPAVNEEWI